jgi:hypothetical protein
MNESDWSRVFALLRLGLGEIQKDENLVKALGDGQLLDYKAACARLAALRKAAGG